MSSLVLMARCCVAPVLPTSGSYKLSTPFSAVVPSSGEGVGQRSPVCDWELCGYSFSAYGSVGGSGVSSHPSCTEQLLWRGMRAALTYREIETTLKINLALCPLSKNNSSRLIPEVCKLPIRWLRNIFKSDPLYPFRVNMHSYFLLLFLFYTQKETGDRRMATWIKCLSCKTEDHSLASPEPT